MSGFLEAVEALTSSLPRVYRTNSVPKSPTYPYVAFSVAGDRPEAYTLDASHGFRFRRITWQAFGKTVDSATATDDAMVAALLDQVPVVEGYDCGPCRADVGVLGAIGRDPDDGGIVTVTSTLLFTATEEA